MRLPAKALWLTLWSVCVAQECNGPPPRKQTEILTGSWSDQGYPQGTKATYKCRPGYRTYGTITMECRGGQWVALNPHKTCQKKPCGHPGDTPFGSFELAEGDKFEYGAKVVYTCDEGYQMIGDTNFRDCDADGWTNDIPLCDVVKCLPVDAPENGKLISSAFELSQEYSYGQVVKFECNAGFKLGGPSEIHCSGNGQWSADKPNCVGISCPVPQIENGEPTSPKAMYRENERLQYKCLPGYVYGGRAETVCTQSGWTPPPSCQEKTCDPPRIANSHFRADRSKYRVGDRITYSCKSGFYPPTQGNTATCTAMGWDPPPRCSFKPCDFPEIKHGRLYREEAHRPSFPVYLGTWFYYHCDENYVTATESSWDYITCRKEGWTPKLPCRRKCIFNYLENGHRPQYEQRYLQGQSVIVHCYQGYTLQNKQTSLTCTENGWRPAPKCIPVATCLRSKIKIEKGFISDTKSEYLVNQEVKYKCNQDYVTEDGRTSGHITCLQNGWSAQPRCIKHCDMPIFENARATITGKPFRLNDTLDYQCLDGYENRDGSTNGSMLCGEDGWSHLPTCFKSADKCGRPPAISNGDITSFPLKAYPPWSRVEYQCQAYYELQGPNYVTCSYAKWSEPPRCEDPCVISENIMSEKNIQLKGEHDKPYYVKVGDSVEFVCKSGHKAVTSEGSFQAVCREGTVEYPKCE